MIQRPRSPAKPIRRPSRKPISAQLREAGFNRLSIGVQSFDPDELKRLERVHSVDEVYLTVERARQAGFDNLSLDLMFALPGQTVKRWQENIQKAIDLNPDHISAYNLTIEPDTVFYKQQSQGQLTMPPDDFQRELFEITINTLTGAGYEHYEISNYAKPGKQSRHNLNYWVNGEYIGLGAGASSTFNGERYQKYKPACTLHCADCRNPNGGGVTRNTRPKATHGRSRDARTPPQSRP